MLRLEQNRGVVPPRWDVTELRLVGVTATALSWIGATLSVTGNLVFLIAFSTVSWGRSLYSGYTEYNGLWKRCHDINTNGHSDTPCVPIASTNPPGYVTASQVFSCILLIGSLVQSCSVMVYLCIKKFKQDKRMALCIVLSCGINVIMGLMIAITYGCGFTSHHSGSGFTHILSSSYGLAVVSLILHALTLVIYFIELSRNKFLIPI